MAVSLKTGGNTYATQLRASSRLHFIISILEVYIAEMHTFEKRLSNHILKFMKYVLCLITYLDANFVQYFCRYNKLTILNYNLQNLQIILTVLSVIIINDQAYIA